MVNTSFTVQKEVSVTSNSELIPNASLAGRLPYFITAWEKVTQDQEILSIVKGYEIAFVSLTSQEKIPNLSKEQFSLLEQKGLEMLEKGAIQKQYPHKDNF